MHKNYSDLNFWENACIYEYSRRISFYFFVGNAHFSFLLTHFKMSLQDCEIDSTNLVIY